MRFAYCRFVAALQEVQLAETSDAKRRGGLRWSQVESTACALFALTWWMCPDWVWETGIKLEQESQTSALQPTNLSHRGGDCAATQVERAAS